MPRKKVVLAPAPDYKHRSCKHIDELGFLVITDNNGVRQVYRPADRFELAVLSPIGDLCFANALLKGR